MTMTENATATTVLIQTAYLRAAMIAASKDSARPVLCTVAITVDDSGKGHVRATDSYMLFYSSPQAHQGEPVMLLDAKELDNALKPLGKGEYVSLSYVKGERTAHVNISGGSIPVANLAGYYTYPDTKRLVPDTDRPEDATGAAYIGFNPAFVAKACKIATALDKSCGNILRLHTWTKEKPAVWEFTTVAGAGLLQMPVRVA